MPLFRTVPGRQQGKGTCCLFCSQNHANAARKEAGSVFFHSRLGELTISRSLPPGVPRSIWLPRGAKMQRYAAPKHKLLRGCFFMCERKRRPLLLLFTLGPGVLAAMADNDAGGLISYLVTGTKFGWAVFVPMSLCLAAVTYTVQEMAMRLGVSSGLGYTRLVRERFGRGWTALQTAALFAENELTLLTEFAGMSAGLELLGLPPAAAVGMSAALALSVAFFSGSEAKQRFGLAIGAVSLLFPVLACAAAPRAVPAETAALFAGRGSVWYAAALAGNAVAPWMIFYQNGAYADRRNRAQAIRGGRRDTRVGCACQTLVAASLIFIGSALGGVLPAPENAGAPQIAASLGTCFGRPAGVLFAAGLFCAGLLAAVTVSFSSARSIAESLGWAKNTDADFRKAPGFCTVYAFSVLLAAAAALVPQLRRSSAAVFVQAAGGVLMMPILVILTLLTSDPAVMGADANTSAQKFRAWFCTGILTAASAATIFLMLYQ